MTLLSWAGAICQYLLQGSDVLYLPKSWLSNTDRLRQYEGYTRRQLQQGKVVADVAEMRRREFWKTVGQKKKPTNVVRGRFA